jgi:hypothetical protein
MNPIDGKTILYIWILMLMKIQTFLNTSHNFLTLFELLLGLEERFVSTQITLCECLKILLFGVDFIFNDLFRSWSAVMNGRVKQPLLSLHFSWKTKNFLSLKHSNTFINGSLKNEFQILLSSCTAVLRCSFNHLFFWLSRRYIVQLHPKFQSILSRWGGRMAEDRSEKFSCICGKCTWTLLQPFDKTEKQNPIPCMCSVILMFFLTRTFCDRTLKLCTSLFFFLWMALFILSFV